MYPTIGLRTPNQLAWAWDWCDLRSQCYIEGANTITLQRYHYFDKNVMKFLYRWASTVCIVGVNLDAQAQEYL